MPELTPAELKERCHKMHVDSFRERLEKLRDMRPTKEDLRTIQSDAGIDKATNKYSAALRSTMFR